MSGKTNLVEARVKHLVEAAELTHTYQQFGARDRFIRLAEETLDSKRVPQAQAWRDRLGQIGEAA